VSSVPQVYETISLLEIDRIIRSVDALDSEVTQAMKYAVAATAKMAQRLSTSKLGEDLAMDISAARRRLRKIKASAGKSHRGGRMKRAMTRDIKAAGGIWFGLNPLDPIKDFNPSVRQAGRKGTLLTGHDAQLPGSFMGHDKAGNVRVFHRKGEARLPIKRTRYDINARALNTITGAIWPQVEAFFYKSFRYNLERVIAEGQ
jgi:hypothetical protein